MTKISDINFITIHPDFIESYFKFGVFSSASKKKLVNLNVINLRDHAVDKHGTVDDSPFGGGDGMVLRPDVLKSSIENIKSGVVIYAGPTGQKFDQKAAEKLKSKLDSGESITFVCGRFGGVDQRFLDQYVDEQYSMGDFIISGGELPSLIISDAVLRLVPGVLGNSESYENDSFSSSLNGMLEYPLYTKPRDFEGQTVPDVLVSGNHKLIHEWKVKESKKRTQNLRPDLLSEK